MASLLSALVVRCPVQILLFFCDVHYFAYLLQNVAIALLKINGCWASHRVEREGDSLEEGEHDFPKQMNYYM